MPSLPEVVSNIVGEWLLIVVYLKKTERRTYGDNLVVPVAMSFICSSCCFVLEGNRRLLFFRPVDEKQISPLSPDPRSL